MITEETLKKALKNVMRLPERRGACYYLPPSVYDAMEAQGLIEPWHYKAQLLPTQPERR